MAKHVQAISVNTEEPMDIDIADSKIKKKYGADVPYYLVIGDVTITFVKTDVLLASIPEKQRKNYYWIQEELYKAVFHSRYDN